jgi:hypothetical protein
VNRRSMENVTHEGEIRDYFCIMFCFCFLGWYEYQVKVVEKHQDTHFISNTFFPCAIFEIITRNAKGLGRTKK